jgi:hypothetical protein
MKKINREILEKLPCAYQLFYKIYKEAGFEIIDESENDIIENKK